MSDGLEMTIHTDCELVTIWYPDGDICADIVYGNLALDIDARDMGRLIVAAPGLLAALKAQEEAEAMWDKIRTWQHRDTGADDGWDALYGEMIAQYAKAKELRQLALAKAEANDD